jgi:Ca2+-binding RTX toxin-like protein
MATFTTMSKINLLSSMWLKIVFDTAADPMAEWTGVDSGYWEPYDFNPTHVRLIERNVYDTGDTDFSEIEILGPLSLEKDGEVVTSIGGSFVTIRYEHVAVDGNEEDDANWSLTGASVSFSKLSAVADVNAYIFRGNDSIYGSAENDLLAGYAGADFLSGGAGNDVLIGGAGADNLNGGSGRDTARYSGAEARVIVNLQANNLNRGEAKGDRLFEIEVLVGSKFADKLTGDDRANELSGGLGNDVLQGAGGKDLLIGGAGADVLFGGGGADTFLFKSHTASTVNAKGRDTIADFRRKDGDKIDLAGIDAVSPTKKINDQFTFIGDKGFTFTEGQLRFVTKKGDTFVYGDVNGDAKADFAIKLAGFAHDLKASDFVL